MTSSRAFDFGSTPRLTRAAEKGASRPLGRWGLAWLLAGASGLVSGAEDSVVLDPVEVQAGRVAESPPGAPSAVSAYDGEFLSANGIVDYEGLARLTPGFFVSAQSPENVSLNLRGISSDSNDPRVQPRVSVFQDGVALGQVQGGGVALFDVDEAAVFKGPQATRFGKGVQSGALALTSRRAENLNSASLTLGAGDYGAREAEFSVNSPVVTDALFARVAFYADRHDGYLTNLADGSDLQGEDTVAVRTSLRWQPSSATTGDLIFSFQQDDTPGVDFKSGVIPVSPTSTDTDPFTNANLTRGAALGVERTITGLTGIVRHELNEAWTITSTSAWREVDSVNEFDADGSYLYLLELGEDFDGRQLSQELRFSYDRGGRFTASVGGNLAWAKNAQTVTIRTDENALYFFLTKTAPPAPLNPRYAEHDTNTGETTSGDIFGRADYKVTERLTAGAGLRLTEERLVSRYQSFAAETPGNLAGVLPTSAPGQPNDIFRISDGELKNSDSVASWAGEADARYAFTPRFASFAKVSRGRRPPVLNFDTVTLERNRDAEEQVWSYEAGIEGASASRRIRYDASVFQYYFDHFQTQRVTDLGVRGTFDGGRARGRGFESSVQADLARELTLFATYGFTDARFSAYSEDGEAQAFAGDTFRLTSRHVISLGGTLSLPGPDRGTVFFTPLYTYRSAYYFEDDNSQNGGTLRQPGFGLVDLRLGYRPRSSRWEVVAYVNNAFDKEHLLDAGNTGGSYGLPTFVPAAPRTVGVKATVRF